jgi:TonB-linked SusC/RagA family outer membrane protein
MKIAIKREQNPNLFEILSSANNLREAKKIYCELISGRCNIWKSNFLKKMRNVTLLILITVTQTLALESYAQTKQLSLNIKNEAILNILNKIEDQSEFYFMYDATIVDVNQRKSISCENQPITTILDQLLEDTKIVYEISNRQIVLTSVQKADVGQQKTISGRVTDSSGSPLPGVTVAVKAATRGTITDANGNYTLPDVSGDAALIFSFVGMKSQEIPISGRTSINVIMDEEAIGIDEVVAVGYGFKKKVNLTGSVASVNSEILKKVPPAGSTTNVLAGRLPGLISKQTSGTPGSDAASLSIRGFGSPLVVVDGVESSFNNIDPNEIESISILKDASAAIYGARAGNGVILVTSKRGKDGKPTITINSSYSLQSITNYPKTMSSGQFAEYDREKRMHQGAQQRFTEEDVAKYYAGTDPDYPSTDWYDVLIKSFAPMQHHNLSVSGGSDKIKYFGLIGYMDQETFWKKNGGNFQRYNIRSNIDAKITNDLSMQLDFSNINEFRKFPARDEGGMWHDFWCAYPIYPASLPDPTKLSYTAPALGGALHSSNRKTIGYNDNDAQDIKAGVALKYNFPFIKGLYAKLYLNYSQNYSNTKNFNKPASFYTYNYASDTYTLKGTWNPEASLSQTSAKSRTITNQFSFNYDNIVAENHTISALVLYESIDYSYDYITAARYHFLTPAIEYLFAGSVKDQYANGSATEMGRKSFVSRLNYSFKGKYLFETTFRADASAKFPSKKRWGYFPSLSGGWKISEEGFIKDNIGWLENLKLRGGISNTGYDNVSDFAYLAGYQLGQNYIFGTNIETGITTTGLANPNLTWEKMSTYNLGLDFSIFNSKLYGEFDVFYRKLDGIPATRLLSLPSTFGASLPPENLNSSNDRGFEAMLGTRGRKGDLSWDISGNISWSRSKWNHYDEPDYSADPEKTRVYQVSGQWTDRVIGYKTDGLYTSQVEIDAMTFDQDGIGNKTISPGDIKYIDINKDEVLDWKDQVDLGPGPIPHVMLGLSTNLQYKNFDLSILLQGAGGNQVEMTNPEMTNFQGDAETISLQMFKERWTEENNNPHASFIRSGSLAQGGGFSDFYLKKAGYIRLKTLNFGYNLPKELLEFAKINSLRIYFAGTNLFTLDRLKKYGLDPEAPLNDNTWLHYPQQRVFTFGLNLTL